MTKIQLFLSILQSYAFIKCLFDDLKISYKLIWNCLKYVVYTTQRQQCTLYVHRAWYDIENIETSSFWTAVFGGHGYCTVYTVGQKAMWRQLFRQTFRFNSFSFQHVWVSQLFPWYEHDGDQTWSTYWCDNGASCDTKYCWNSCRILAEWVFISEYTQRSCSLPPVTENSTRENVFFCY